MVNWQQLIDEQREALIHDTQTFLQIPSVKDEATASVDAPFGRPIQDALEHLLTKAEQDGFTVKNLDNLAAHIEFGQGEEIVGILCHIDVVPAGDGWSSDPFGAEIRDGKLYARGAVDDKGPTMSAYYAMKTVKELGVPLNRRVRMIIGTDEESDWKCVDHYFANEEMPTLGFAPDADFPIIFAEKGIADIVLTMKAETEVALPTVSSFTAGTRFNMVPDAAKATVHVIDPQVVETAFQSFLTEQQLEGSVQHGAGLTLHMKGVSAHGSEPHKGVNAGHELVKFLLTLDLDDDAKRYFTFVNDYFVDELYGVPFGIDHESETGNVTLNLGIMSYEANEGGALSLNLRYPATASFEEIYAKVERFASEQRFTLAIDTHKGPHHVPKEHELIQTLLAVYERQTGAKAELLSTGGGTYARTLAKGVAFGPVFPGREDVIHQKDEYIVVDDLVKATSIYAEAIYQLAK